MDANARFERCLNAVLLQEGGFADLAGDKGGPTKFGISTPTLTEWRGHPVSKQDVWNLMLDEARAIYRARYWNKILGDLLPAGTDLFTLDMSVNMGQGAAARILQQALGLTQDGLVGPRTVEEANRRNCSAFIESLTSYRLAHYHQMEGWAEFGKGWFNRSMTICATAKAWANEPTLPPALAKAA